MLYIKGLVCCQMGAMDTKLGIIYCTISEYNSQLQLPQNCTDCNETYGILKS